MQTADVAQRAPFRRSGVAAGRSKTFGLVQPMIHWALSGSAAVGDGHWQLEGSSTAELYQRYLVPAITSRWAEDLVERAQPRAGEAVLDVACGTGVVARSAAKRHATVTGIDLNAGMLDVAR